MKTKISAVQMSTVFAMIIFLITVFVGLTSCYSSGNQPVKREGLAIQRIMIVIGDDESISTRSFPRLDTTYIRGLLDPLLATGGTMVVYKIGNPSDQAGFRTTFLSIPEIDPELLMSRQVEVKRKEANTKKQNELSVRKLLNEVQQFVFNDSLRHVNTDLIGFFGKVDVLMNEPQYSDYQKYVLVVSDGIQSINNHDTPARYKFKHTAFNLCLCGWKTFMPDKDTVKVMQFESPMGFSEYVNQLSTSKN